MSLAKSRWDLLKETIKNKRIPEPERNPASKRGFQRFQDLVSWTCSEEGESRLEVDVFVKPTNNNYLGYNNTHHCLCTNGVAHHPKKTTYNNNKYHLTVFRSKECSAINIDALRGFDRTGRICIWPAEQVLAYWCLKNAQVFEGKSVIEIGGGFHCLAGLAIAKYIRAKEVVLTDGDPTNLEQVRRSLAYNSGLTKSVAAITLNWEGYTIPELEGRFDQVIAADVVYDSCVFEALIKTVSKLLKPGGHFILFNPSRDAKLLDLITTANRSHVFRDIQLSDDYDCLLTSVVSKLLESDPNFHKDWHYPLEGIFRK